MEEVEDEIVRMAVHYFITESCYITESSDAFSQVIFVR